MKFAQELEEHSVPEWASKYLDYKTAKKKLKTISRALRNSSRSSPSLSRRNVVDQRSPLSSLRDAPVRMLFARSTETTQHGHGVSATSWATERRNPESLTVQPRPITEISPIRVNEARGDGPHMTRYGSIIGSPDDSYMSKLDQAPSLTLPDPALTHEDDVESNRARSAEQPFTLQRRSTDHPSIVSSATPNAFGNNTARAGMGGPHGRRNGDPHGPLVRNNTMPYRSSSFLPRFLRQHGATAPRTQTLDDVALETYREIDFRKEEFFRFLQKELGKIEGFYKSKEEEATKRLAVLREQLHIMRNYRLNELRALEHHYRQSPPNAAAKHKVPHEIQENARGFSGMLSRSGELLATVDHAQQRLESVIAGIRSGPIGKTSKAMKSLSTPPLDGTWKTLNNDYERRQTARDVSYRAAKRKLKVALAEYYRGLELLKSYALFNRTAFRKINKKYDKAVKPQHMMSFVEANVVGAHFVTSDVLESLIKATEDLYARYFERGNHKVAVGKLRAKTAKAGDYSASTFRVGCLVMGGTVLAIQGLVYGLQQDIASHDPVLQTQASYLLQLYAGYFLGILAIGLFCVDAGLFTRAKVNYQFIFEFDSRHMLDWKQLCEIPALLYFLMGLIMWLNFTRYAGESMYVHWPVVLIGPTVLILFLPLPVLYHRSRKWLLYTCWRLLCSGLYPVEFRDFFTGDIFCSLTYAMGNIELFFCLYARHWSDPPQCNSSHSRLLGFFTALPGIWRLLQCARRYFDTRVWFPHAVNGGKYGFTILYYVSLSMYRMDHAAPYRAFFIFCALVNAVYCTVWDLVMDWSLTLNPKHRPPFLRDTRGFPRATWLYYVALIVDPIVRFNWILYAIFTHSTQHSTVVSFVVAISEVFRRGLWILLRVENEHCTNISKFRAYRNAPLPYEIRTEGSTTSLPDSINVLEDPHLENTSSDAKDSTKGDASSSNANNSPTYNHEPTQNSTASAVDVEPGSSSAGPPSMRQRRTTSSQADSPVARAFKRVGSTMLAAHALDYQRRKPIEETSRVPADESDDSDEDDVADERSGEAR